MSLGRYPKDRDICAGPYWDRADYLHKGGRHYCQGVVGCSWGFGVRCFDRVVGDRLMGFDDVGLGGSQTGLVRTTFLIGKGRKRQKVVAVGVVAV